MSSFIKNPHDHLIKNTLSKPELAKNFLENFLPTEILEITDLSNLKIIPSSFIHGDLKNSEADFIFQVSLNDQSAYLYCLMEHQSSQDSSMPLRLLNYMTQFWLNFNKKNKNKKLPIIIPLILSQCKDSWKCSTAFEDMFKLNEKTQKIAIKYLPLFVYLLIDLTQINSDELQLNLENKLVLEFMKSARRGTLKQDLNPLLKISQKLIHKDYLGIIEILLRYIVAVAEDFNVNELCAIVSRELNPEEGSSVMTLAEKLVYEGESRGEILGKQRSLYKIYVKKFGIDSTIEAQIQNIDDLEKLDNCIVDFYDFASQKEFLDQL